MSNYAHLISSCIKNDSLCTGCEQAVKQAPSGRFYITMGHPGFNSRANNGDGYATKAAAENVIKKTVEKAAKLVDTQISEAFRLNCSGIEIPLLSIPSIFAAGRQAIQRGENLTQAVVEATKRAAAQV